MTYYVLSGTLNPTHSLTHSLTLMPWPWPCIVLGLGIGTDTAGFVSIPAGQTVVLISDQLRKHVRFKMAFEALVVAE